MTIPASASGAFVSITTTPTELLNDATTKNVGTSIVVAVKTGETNSVLIHIPKLHASGDFHLIDPGEKEVFRLGTDDISSALAKSTAGTVDIKWAFVARGLMR